MLAHDLTSEQRAGLAAMYHRLANSVIWAGYDPRPDMIIKARELERVEVVHAHESWRA